MLVRFFRDLDTRNIGELDKAQVIGVYLTSFAEATCTINQNES